MHKKNNNKWKPLQKLIMADLTKLMSYIVSELWKTKYQNSELRTQTFIYLTNNVYNYIQIVKTFFNKPGQETTRFAASAVATHEKTLIKSNYNVACQPYCSV